MRARRRCGGGGLPSEMALLQNVVGNSTRSASWSAPRLGFPSQLRDAPTVDWNWKVSGQTVSSSMSTVEEHGFSWLSAAIRVATRQRVQRWYPACRRAIGKIGQVNEQERVLHDSAVLCRWGGWGAGVRNV